MQNEGSNSLFKIDSTMQIQIMHAENKMYGEKRPRGHVWPFSALDSIKRNRRKNMYIHKTSRVHISYKMKNSIIFLYFLALSL